MGCEKKHGHKPVIPLWFSKSGNPEIEKAYATHYVDLGWIGQLKKGKMEKAAVTDSEGISDKMPGMLEMKISDSGSESLNGIIPKVDEEDIF